MRSLTLVVFTLFVSAAALGQAFTLSDEIPISEPTSRPAPWPQTRPSVAAGDTDFFAVWEHAYAEILGSRIDAQSGTAIDAMGGIAIQPTYWDSELEPAAVWNGSTYSVVFISGDYGVKGVQLSPAGKMVTQSEITGSRNVSSVDIAFTGAVHLVAWTERDGLVRARVFDRALQPVSGEITISSFGEEIALASGVSGFAVTWRNSQGTFFATVSSAGVVSGPVALSTDATSETDIASDGVGYAVFRAGADSEVIRVDADGTVSERVSFPTGIEPAITWDGLHYLAAWSAGERIYGAELDAALNMTRAPIRLVLFDTIQRSPALASNGARTIVLWADTLPGQTLESEIRSIATSADAFAASPARVTPVVSLSLAHQTPLGALWRDDLLTTLWSDLEGTGPALRLGLTTPQGEALLAGGADLAPVSDAQFAWNGDIYLVAFSHAGGVYAMWVDRDGRSLGGMFIDSGRGPQVASDGEDFLITWSRPNGFPIGSDLLSTTVSAAGLPGALRKLPILNPDANSHATREIVWNGREYVVLSMETQGFGGFSTEAILSTKVSRTGDVGTPVVIAAGGRYRGYFDSMDMAFNGREILYVWGVGGEPLRARLGESGPVTVVHEAAYVIDTAWDGSQFVFALRSRGFILKRGERITELPSDVQFLRLAASAGGRLAIVYQRNIEQIAGVPHLDIRRAFVRFLEPLHKRRAVHP